MKSKICFESFATALGFFYEWPTQARTAEIVLERASEIDGNMYYLLNPVAHLIEGKHPLAATLLRRAMIEDTLAKIEARLKSAESIPEEKRRELQQLLATAALRPSSDPICRRQNARWRRWRAGYWAFPA